MNTYNLSRVNNYSGIQNGVANVKDYQNNVVAPILENIVINGEILGAAEYHLDNNTASSNDINFNRNDLYNSHAAVNNDITRIQELINDISDQIARNNDQIVELNVAIMNLYEQMDSAEDDETRAALAEQIKYLRDTIESLKQDNEILENTKEMYQEEQNIKTDLLLEIKNIITAYEKGSADISRLYQNTFYETNLLYDLSGNVVGSEERYYNDSNQLIEIVRNETEGGHLAKQTYMRGNYAISKEITYQYDNNGNVSGSRINDYDLEEKLVKTTVDIVNSNPYYITYEYNEDGNLAIERTYDGTDDKMSTERTYDEFGKLESVANYKKDGYLTTISYYTNLGTIDTTETYDNGKLVSRVEFNEDKPALSEEQSK